MSQSKAKSVNQGHHSGPQSQGDQQKGTVDEREEAGEKEPFIERQSPRSGTQQSVRDSGRVSGNRGSFNPAQGHRPSGI